MTYEIALEKLNRLRQLIERIMCESEPYPDKMPLQDQISELYGEVEEIIERMVGRNNIIVPSIGHGLPPATYPNYIEAGFLSTHSLHRFQGHKQLLKIIGKVRQLVDDPTLPQNEASITGLTRTLYRFRECCQYLQKHPTNEQEVQDIIWIMLRSQFERVDRENFLPSFGLKAYKPDFGLPELSTLIEVKFVGGKTSIAALQDQILADASGYLTEGSKYKALVVFVYDKAHKLLDPKNFVEDLRKVNGITEVIVIAGIGERGSVENPTPHQERKGRE